MWSSRRGILRTEGSARKPSTASVAKLDNRRCSLYGAPCRGFVHVVNERGGVGREQRQVGNLLPTHDGRREIPGKRVRVGKAPAAA
jgi:hypothetical protein